MKEFLASTHCALGTVETVGWPCEPIILSIGHFEGLTEAQLNSWSKTVSLCLITVC